MAAAVRILGNDGFAWLGFDLLEVLHAIGPHRHLRWRVEAEDWVERREADPDRTPWPQADPVLSRPSSSDAAELTSDELERLTGVVHNFRTEFVVPIAAIPPEGLLFAVVDRDLGQNDDVLGQVRASAAELLDAARSPTHLISRSDPQAGLQQLELVVSTDDGRPQAARVDLPASTGIGPVPALRPIRIGDVVTISATGQYRIGGWYDHWLGPAGYPGGGPRGYNFSNEPFHSAPHGCGMALIGAGSAHQGMIVAPCGSAIAPTGALRVGINDTEPRNNEGAARFDVRVRAPSVDEWRSATVAPCSSGRR